VAGKRIAIEAEPGAGPVRHDLELALQGGRGISRGRWIVQFRYRTDLAARGLAVRDGATTLVTWSGPRWEDGLDTTRALFALPSAPTEPRPAELGAASRGGPDDDHGAAISSLTRKPGLDVLEIIRPYAARGERVVWKVRADARALPLGASSSGAATPSPVRAPQALPVETPVRPGALLAGSAALFAALALLFFGRARAIESFLKERSQRARPLIPWPPLARALLGAAVFVAGLALELSLRSPLWGAALVAASVLFALHRPARAASALRAPGQWLPVRREEAFAPPAPIVPGWFDIRTGRGRGLLATIVLVTMAVAAWLARSSSYHAALCALNLAPLLALFFPSPARLAAPDLAVAPLPLLRAIARHVEAASPTARLVPRVRVPRGEVDADELRLVVLPARPIRGLRAIEVAFASVTGPGGHLLLPEVLLRCDEGTPCDEVASTLAPHARASQGRRIDERVLAVAPKLPDARTTASLVVALLERVSAPAPERPDAAAPSPVRRKPAARASASTKGVAPTAEASA
jgi:hypothetical protein